MASIKMGETVNDMDFFLYRKSATSSEICEIDALVPHDFLLV
jgi:hypothetical protein